MEATWRWEGSPETKDFYLAIYAAFACFAIHFLLSITLYQKLAIWLLNRETVTKEIQPEKISKCTESMWKLTYYTTVQIYIFLILYEEPWMGDRKQLFKGWPDQTIKFFRIGSIIFALHHTSDILLETTKLFQYGGKDFAAVMSFVLFSLSWFLIRLIYYPFWIIRSLSYDGIECLNLPDPYHIWIYYVFNTLLLTLLVFHMYWWKLICSMVLRQLKNKGTVYEDIRSDSEDEQ